MHIAETFGELNLQISRPHILKVQTAAIHFTLRKTHPLTFNSPYLGVHPVAFTTADYNTLFDIFGVRKSDVEKVIRQTSTIDRSFMVISDPYNLLTFWLCHLAPIYIKDKQVAHDFMFNLLRLFFYKVFCSVVNNSFRYGANEAISQATVAKLTLKSHIARYESWSKVIDFQVEKILNPHGNFYQTLLDGAPDDLFLRVISENQTSLRQKLVTYATTYYETHAAGDAIKSRSMISENADGERIIAQTATVVDSATQSMLSDILNPNMFAHDASVRDIADSFHPIGARMLKNALLKINETAVLQTSSRTFDKVEEDAEGKLYIGVRPLITMILRTMIRVCREKRVNLGDRALVYTTMRDIMMSSRILDKDVKDIKRSVSHLIDPFNLTASDAAKPALRLAVIYYITYRFLDKMK